MVTFDLNFSVLKKALGKEITLQKLKDTMFDMGMELSGEEAALKAEITPDRSDMLGIQGLSRALRAYLGLKPRLKVYELKKSNYKLIIDKSVNEIRPFTVCAVVKNLSFDNEKITEIIDLQEKLHATYGRNRRKAAIGIYPFEKIKMPIYYRAVSPEKIKFQPLEESREMTGSEILTETSTGREYAPLLEGKLKYPIFIDSAGEILSMPPIINSHKTGKVTENTKEIFIECSGSDLGALKKLLNIIVTMFAEMGGEIYSVEIEGGSKKVFSPDLSTEKREISIDYINKILGSDFNAVQTVSLLERMQYSAKSKGKKVILEVPSFRTDIWHDVDIVDDVARANGFNNFQSKMKAVSTMASTLKETDLREELTNLMAGQGYQEVFTLALTDKVDQFKKMNISEQPHICLEGAKEGSLNMVRSWLLPETIKSLVNNKNKSFNQKIFELQDVVILDTNSETKSKNVTKLCVLNSNANATFTEAKQILDFVMNTLGKNYLIKSSIHGSFIEGRTGEIIINNKPVGIIGEINPKVLSNLKLEAPIAAFELDLEALF